MRQLENHGDRHQTSFGQSRMLVKNNVRAYKKSTILELTVKCHHRRCHHTHHMLGQLPHNHHLAMDHLYHNSSRRCIFHSNCLQSSPGSGKSPVHAKNCAPCDKFCNRNLLHFSNDNDIIVLYPSFNEILNPFGRTHLLLSALSYMTHPHHE